MKTDAELLRAYAETRDEDAFTELVRRHIDLVYSAALRQVGGDAHFANDVAQAVFTDLARKAAALAERAALAGWLFTSTHYAAAKVVRAERRRRVHEQESHTMQELTSHDEAAGDWGRLRPVLDAAMLELNEPDREAVLLRFFTNRSFAEIGVALRLSEDTARKRVERALDKLHALLARRGISSTSAALALVLSQHATSAAPAGAAAVVSSAVLSGAAVSSTAVAVFSMSKLSVGVAGIVMAAMSVMLVVQRARVSAAQSEIAAGREEHARTTTEIARVRQRMTEASAALMTVPAPNSPAEITIPPSATTARWGSIVQIRAALDQSYAPLFRRLKLGHGRTEALKDLLTERIRVCSFELSDFLVADGVASGELSWSERHDLEVVAAREIDERIRGLLGEADFEYFRTFQRTRPLRAPFATLAEQLKFTAEPLRDEQIDQLVSWTAEEFTSFDLAMAAWPTSVTEGVLTRARAMLSPLQFEKLQHYRSGMESLRRMIAMSRAAEAKGQIKPTGHSLAP